MPEAHAMVLCVHHKPWLAMSTVVTALLQDGQDIDICFVDNVGDGHVDRPSYACYRRLMDEDARDASRPVTRQSVFCDTKNAVDE